MPQGTRLVVRAPPIHLGPCCLRLGAVVYTAVCMPCHACVRACLPPVPGHPGHMDWPGGRGRGSQHLPYHACGRMLLAGPSEPPSAGLAPAFLGSSWRSAAPPRDSAAGCSGCCCCRSRCAWPSRSGEVVAVVSQGACKWSTFGRCCCLPFLSLAGGFSVCGFNSY